MVIARSTIKHSPPNIVDSAMIATASYGQPKYHR